MRSLIELLFGSEQSTPLPDPVPPVPERGILDQSRDMVATSLDYLCRQLDRVEEEITASHRHTAELEERRAEIVRAKAGFANLAAELSPDPVKESPVLIGEMDAGLVAGIEEMLAMDEPKRPAKRRSRKSDLVAVEA